MQPEVIQPTMFGSLSGIVYIFINSFLSVSETEVLRQELLELLVDGVEDQVVTQASLEPAAYATDWEIRNTVSSQKWKEARPFLIENMLASQDPHPNSRCQCGKQASVRCLDCLSFPFLCEDCDAAVHTRFVLHNREAVTGGFLQPLSEFQQQIATVFKSYAFHTMYEKYAILVKKNTFIHATLLIMFSPKCHTFISTAGIHFVDWGLLLLFIETINMFNFYN